MELSQTNKHFLKENVYAEWLEADGLGGFASGTVCGIRTRRYHALLLVATTPPTGRLVLVNGCETWVHTPAGAFALSSHAYAPDVVHPDGMTRIVSFESEPWPCWRFRLEDGTEVLQELFVTHDAPMTVLSWRLVQRRQDAELSVRPLLSGRDFHALHHENLQFRFDADRLEGRIHWRPYPGIPSVVASSNGAYVHQPDWYRNVLYEQEQVRGLDYLEDLASPGIFHWDLSRGEAVWVLTIEGQDDARPSSESIAQRVAALRATERRRRHVPSRLHRAADAYLVRRHPGKTLIAGYPWFADWGRDTFVALRGLCLATGRLEDARQVLLQWVETLSDGMIPNRFPERGEPTEFNAVDASLWYIVAVYDYLRAMEARRRRVPQADRRALEGAVESILTGYSRGTRFGIGVDEDGLLKAGVPGMQLTWMDAKVGDWVVTPRIGKPVEVEVLWLNALWIASRFSPRWGEAYERGRDAFRRRFWNEVSQFLYDVVDCDHHAGTVDGTCRPNQIFAVGGLPLNLLDEAQGRAVVHTVETRLWTPMGLRSLAPGEPGYTERYRGGVHERDAAYHQGTVWPWLMGPFVEAWVRVHGATAQAKREARLRFLEPLLGHFDDAGLGHLCEVADADPPHTPGGCPFQAWSVGEALRLLHVVLVDQGASVRREQEQPHAVSVD